MLCPCHLINLLFFLLAESPVWLQVRVQGPVTLTVAPGPASYGKQWARGPQLFTSWSPATARARDAPSASTGLPAGEAMQDCDPDGHYPAPHSSLQEGWDSMGCSSLVPMSTAQSSGALWPEQLSFPKCAVILLWCGQAQRPCLGLSWLSQGRILPEPGLLGHFIAGESPVFPSLLPRGAFA